MSKEIKEKLTELESKVLETLKDPRIKILRRHMGHNGRPCYRALDEAINPLFNVDKLVADKLVEKGYLKLSNEIYSGGFSVEL